MARTRFYLKSATALVAAALLWQTPAQADDALRASIEKHYDAELDALFKHFHANPELSFREEKTAKRLALEIAKYGYDVTEGVGGTGVVAVMKNGLGPTVMLRADMDGLPVKENSGLAYASTARQVDIDDIEKPTMHACGHDVHITSMVGTAKQMAERKDQWSGTLVLIGQPAEERVGGAKAMIADGLFTRFPKPDYAVGFHVSSRMPSGKVMVRPSITASSADTVEITVRGVGAHGASPHKGIDPVLVASQIVVSLQSIVSRTIAPLEPGVITVGAIQGGSKSNIIGNRVDMQLTVRSDSYEVREKLLAGIERVSKGTALALGVPDDLLPIVTYGKESTPPTINDTPTADRIVTALKAALPEKTIYTTPRTGMGGEDFAYFGAPKHGVKAVFFSVGGTPQDEVFGAPSHHSPLFKIEPEPSVIRGTEAMVIAALELLN